jgi:predicted N-acetyltransferase YhbS
LGTLCIAELRSTPEYVDQVARWLHAQWYSHRADTLAQVRDRLAGGPAAAAFSTTFVGHRGRRPVGTFTLEESTEPRSGRPLLCLSNVFVPQTCRRRGTGRQLCEAALEQARALRIPRLTLFTSSHAPYYAGMGWTYVDLVAMESGGCDVPVFMMRRDVGTIGQGGRTAGRLLGVRSRVVAGQR